MSPSAYEGVPVWMIDDTTDDVPSMKSMRPELEEWQVVVAGDVEWRS